MGLPRVWSLLDEENLLQVCAAEDYAALQEEFDLTVNPGPDPVSYAQLVAEIPDYQALLTGWGGGPPLHEDFYEAAQRLKIIAHLAGSVRHIILPDMIEPYLKPRGIVTFTGRGALAENVAESTVGLLIATSRRWFEHVEYFRQTGNWGAPDVPRETQHLLGSTLGLLGASCVGRRVIARLHGWDLQMLLYDPYVSAAEAQKLGVEKVGLEELFRRVTHVAVCLPRTPETEGIITAELLSLLPDGAVFVNCARGAVVDMAALIAQAASGRLIVGVDVTDPQEPLPPDSPIREIPNFYVLPHIAGLGTYGFHLIGRMTLQALRDCFAGRPVPGAIDYDHFQTLA